MVFLGGGNRRRIVGGHTTGARRLHDRQAQQKAALARIDAEEAARPGVDDTQG